MLTKFLEGSKSRLSINGAYRNDVSENITKLKG